MNERTRENRSPRPASSRWILARLWLASLVLLGAVAPAHAQLTGTYTIGGTSPDYASFGAATAALESQGVSGPVEFLVRAGTYTEGTAPVIDLVGVAGVSATHRITFRPDAASGATVDDVVLERSDGPPTASPSYLVDLRTDYVTLRELTLRSGDTVSPSYTFSRFVGIQANSGERRGVEVLDCVLESRGHASGGVVETTGSNATFRDLRVAGNRIHDFTVGVALGGYASSYTDVTIEDNRFTGMRFDSNAATGFSVSVLIGGSGLIVRGNVLDYAGARGIAGINVGSSSAGASIAGNAIVNVSTGGLNDAFTGIYMANGYAGSSIVNNMVSVYTARRTGIAVNGTNGVLVAHNTVYLPARGIDFFGGSQALLLCASNVDVFDNILVDLGTGTNNRTNAIYQQGCGNTGNAFDGNLLYNAQGALAYSDAGAAVATFAAWQAAGNGANSVSRLPEVVNVYNDLHLTGCAAGDPDLYGLPLALVTGDIDGRVRDTSGPTMGAHEARADFAELFGEPALYEAFAGNQGVPLYLDTADVDGDLDIDLVVSLTGAWRGIGVLENLGDGTFAPLTPIDLNAVGAGGGQGPTVVGTADIDGDGAVDIGVAREGGSFFEVYWGAGDGSFPSTTAWAINQLNTVNERLGISDFELVDVDGNGYPDLVFTDVGIPSVSGEIGDVGVLCNADGSALVDLGTDFPRPWNPYDMIVADMDGDDTLDLVMNNAHATTLNEIGVLPNTGGPCPAFAASYTGRNHSAQIETAPLLPDMAAADLDADGLVDLAFDDAFSPGPGNQNLPLYFNDGGLDFSVEETLVDVSPDRAPGPIVPMDYEGDGDVDLLVGNETPVLGAEGELVLLLNDGIGQFSPALVCGPSKLPKEPRMLVSDDFDGDGRPDFAAVMQGEKEIAVVLQTVPEPGAGARLAAGLGLLLALGRRRRSAARQRPPLGASPARA